MPQRKKANKQLLQNRFRLIIVVKYQCKVVQMQLNFPKVEWQQI